MKENNNEAISTKISMRNHIIKVAQEIFTKYGFKKTTIDDIASELQKGKSSIYYYFSSKEDIFKAVLDKEAAELKNHILNEIRKTNDPLNKIEVYITARIEGIKRLGVLYNFRKSQHLSMEQALELRAKYDAQEIELIESLLDYGIKKGSFIIKNTKMTAVSILIIIKGLEVPVLEQNSETINERISELLPILFYGICNTASAIN